MFRKLSELELWRVFLFARTYLSNQKKHYVNIVPFGKERGAGLSCNSDLVQQVRPLGKVKESFQVTHWRISRIEQ